MLPLPRGAVWQALFLLSAFLFIKEVRSEGRVVCYYTNWSVYRPGTAKFNPQNINPYLCTHLIYAFGGFTKDNQMKPFDKYQDIEQGGYAKFTGLKTYNKQLKTLIAIGGWNEASSRFSPLVASPERRQQFIKNILKFLRQNHFDGIDLDWEYPAHREGGKERDRDNYAQFVQELRAEFERESQKTGRPRLLLTMAVPAGIEYIDKGYDIPKLNKYLDWFNVLTYDFHSSHEPSVNHHAPLYSLEEESEYNYDSELNIDYSIKYYLKAGADRDKLVLGIPTYGRSYTLINEESNELGAPSEGPGEQGDATREKGYLAYYEICQNIKEDPEWTVVNTNPNAMGPYAYRRTQWVGYDDEDIVKKKAQYVVAQRLGGIMFWAIDNDDFRGICNGKPYPLIEAAKETMLEGLGLGINEVSKPSSPKKPTRARSRENSSSTRNRLSGNNVEKEVTRRPANKRVRVQSTTVKPQTTTIRLTEAEGSSLYIGGRTTTPPPPTTPDPGTDFKCEEEGFFQHPRDCKKYYWCLDSGPSGLGIVAHMFTCPSGLYFNPAADSCDFARNVPCKIKKTTTPSPATSTSTTPRTTARTTSGYRITAATSRTSFFRTTTTTSTTPAPEEDVIEYEDEVEEEDEPISPTKDEEDPKVLKELIELIRKVGGIEELEKHLLRKADGTVSIKDTATTGADPSQTASPISKTIYDKVLSRPGSYNSFRNRLTSTTLYRKPFVSKNDDDDKENFEEEKPIIKNSEKTYSKYSPIVRGNSRQGPQNEGLDKLADFDAFLKEPKQYVTINRHRSEPSKSRVDVENEEDSVDVEEEEVNPDEEEEEEEEEASSSTRRPVTTPAYKSIRRTRPTTTTASPDDNIEREVAAEQVKVKEEKKTYSSLNRLRSKISSTTAPASENIAPSTYRYKFIERSRPTKTSFSSPAQDDEEEGLVEDEDDDESEDTDVESKKVISQVNEDIDGTQSLVKTTRNYANINRKTTIITTTTKPEQTTAIPKITTTTEDLITTSTTTALPILQNSETFLTKEQNPSLSVSTSTESESESAIATSTESAIATANPSSLTDSSTKADSLPSTLAPIHNDSEAISDDLLTSTLNPKNEDESAILVENSSDFNNLPSENPSTSASVSLNLDSDSLTKDRVEVTTDHSETDDEIDILTLTTTTTLAPTTILNTKTTIVTDIPDQGTTEVTNLNKNNSKTNFKLNTRIRNSTLNPLYPNVNNNLNPKNNNNNNNNKNTNSNNNINTNIEKNSSINTSLNINNNSNNGSLNNINSTKVSLNKYSFGGRRQQQQQQQLQQQQQQKQPQQQQNIYRSKNQNRYQQNLPKNDDEQDDEQIKTSRPSSTDTLLTNNQYLGTVSSPRPFGFPRRRPFIRTTTSTTTPKSISDESNENQALAADVEKDVLKPLKSQRTRLQVQKVSYNSRQNQANKSEEINSESTQRRLKTPEHVVDVDDNGNNGSNTQKHVSSPKKGEYDSLSIRNKDQNVEGLESESQGVEEDLESGTKRFYNWRDPRRPTKAPTRGKWVKVTNIQTHERTTFGTNKLSSQANSLDTSTKDESKESSSLNRRRYHGKSINTNNKNEAESEVTTFRSRGLKMVSEASLQESEEPESTGFNSRRINALATKSPKTSLPHLSEESSLDIDSIITTLRTTVDETDNTAAEIQDTKATSAEEKKISSAKDETDLSEEMVDDSWLALETTSSTEAPATSTKNYKFTGSRNKNVYSYSTTAAPSSLSSTTEKVKSTSSGSRKGINHNNLATNKTTTESPVPGLSPDEKISSVRNKHSIQRGKYNPTSTALPPTSDNNEEKEEVLSSAGQQVEKTKTEEGGLKEEKDSGAVSTESQESSGNSSFLEEASKATQEGSLDKNSTTIGEKEKQEITEDPKNVDSNLTSPSTETSPANVPSTTQKNVDSNLTSPSTEASPANVPSTTQKNVDANPTSPSTEASPASVPSTTQKTVDSSLTSPSTEASPASVPSTTQKNLDSNLTSPSTEASPANVPSTTQKSRLTFNRSLYTTTRKTTKKPDADTSNPLGTTTIANQPPTIQKEIEDSDPNSLKSSLTREARNRTLIKTETDGKGVTKTRTTSIRTYNSDPNTQKVIKKIHTKIIEEKPAEYEYVAEGIDETVVSTTTKRPITRNRGSVRYKGSDVSSLLSFDLAPKARKSETAAPQTILKPRKRILKKPKEVQEREEVEEFEYVIRNEAGVTKSGLEAVASRTRPTRPARPLTTTISAPNDGENETSSSIPRRTRPTRPAKPRTTTTSAAPNQEESLSSNPQNRFRRPFVRPTSVTTTEKGQVDNKVKEEEPEIVSTTVSLPKRTFPKFSTSTTKSYKETTEKENPTEGKEEHSESKSLEPEAESQVLLESRYRKPFGRTTTTTTRATTTTTAAPETSTADDPIQEKNERGYLSRRTTTEKTLSNDVNALLDGNESFKAKAINSNSLNEESISETSAKSSKTDEESLSLPIYHRRKYYKYYKDSPITYIGQPVSSTPVSQKSNNEIRETITDVFDLSKNHLESTPLPLDVMHDLAMEQAREINAELGRSLAESLSSLLDSEGQGSKFRLVNSGEEQMEDNEASSEAVKEQNATSGLGLEDEDLVADLDDILNAVQTHRQGKAFSTSVYTEEHSEDSLGESTPRNFAERPTVKLRVLNSQREREDARLLKTYTTLNRRKNSTLVTENADTSTESVTKDQEETLPKIKPTRKAYQPLNRRLSTTTQSSIEGNTEAIVEEENTIASTTPSSTTKRTFKPLSLRRTSTTGSPDLNSLPESATNETLANQEETKSANIPTPIPLIRRTFKPLSLRRPNTTQSSQIETSTANETKLEEDTDSTSTPSTTTKRTFRPLGLRRSSTTESSTSTESIEQSELSEDEEQSSESSSTPSTAKRFTFKPLNLRRFSTTESPNSESSFNVSSTEEGREIISSTTRRNFGALNRPKLRSTVAPSPLVNATEETSSQKSTRRPFLPANRNKNFSTTAVPLEEVPDEPLNETATEEVSRNAQYVGNILRTTTGKSISEDQEVEEKTTKKPYLILRRPTTTASKLVTEDNEDTVSTEPEVNFTTLSPEVEEETLSTNQNEESSTETQDDATSEQSLESTTVLSDNLNESEVSENTEKPIERNSSVSGTTSEEASTVVSLLPKETESSTLSSVQASRSPLSRRPVRLRNRNVTTTTERQQEESSTASNDRRTYIIRRRLNSTFSTRNNENLPTTRRTFNGINRLRIRTSTIATSTVDSLDENNEEAKEESEEESNDIETSSTTSQRTLTRTRRPLLALNRNRFRSTTSTTEAPEEEINEEEDEENEIAPKETVNSSTRPTRRPLATLNRQRYRPSIGRVTSTTSASNDEDNEDAVSEKLETSTRRTFSSFNRQRLRTTTDSSLDASLQREKTISTRRNLVLLNRQRTRFSTTTSSTERSNTENDEEEEEEDSALDTESEEGNEVDVEPVKATTRRTYSPILRRFRTSTERSIPVPNYDSEVNEEESSQEEEEEVEPIKPTTRRNYAALNRQRLRTTTETNEVLDDFEESQGLRDSIDSQLNEENRGVFLQTNRHRALDEDIENENENEEDEDVKAQINSRRPVFRTTKRPGLDFRQTLSANKNRLPSFEEINPTILPDSEHLLDNMEDNTTETTQENEETVDNLSLRREEKTNDLESTSLDTISQSEITDTKLNSTFTNTSDLDGSLSFTNLNSTVANYDNTILTDLNENSTSTTLLTEQKTNEQVYNNLVNKESVEHVVNDDEAQEVNLKRFQKYQYNRSRSTTTSTTASPNEPLDTYSEFSEKRVNSVKNEDAPSAITTTGTSNKRVRVLKYRRPISDSVADNTVDIQDTEHIVNSTKDNNTDTNSNLEVSSANTNLGSDVSLSDQTENSETSSTVPKVAKKTKRIRKVIRRFKKPLNSTESTTVETKTESVIVNRTRQGFDRSTKFTNPEKEVQDENLSSETETETEKPTEILETETKQKVLNNSDRGRSDEEISSIVTAIEEEETTTELNEDSTEPILESHLEENIEKTVENEESVAREVEEAKENIVKVVNELVKETQLKQESEVSVGEDTKANTLDESRTEIPEKNDSEDEEDDDDDEEDDEETLTASIDDNEQDDASKTIAKEENLDNSKPSEEISKPSDQNQSEISSISSEASTTAETASEASEIVDDSSSSTTAAPSTTTVSSFRRQLIGRRPFSPQRPSIASISTTESSNQATETTRKYGRRPFGRFGQANAVRTTTSATPIRTRTFTPRFNRFRNNNKASDEENTEITRTESAQDQAPRVFGRTGSLYNRQPTNILRNSVETNQENKEENAEDLEESDEEEEDEDDEEEVDEEENKAEDNEEEEEEDEETNTEPSDELDNSNGPKSVDNRVPPNARPSLKKTSNAPSFANRGSTANSSRFGLTGRVINRPRIANSPVTNDVERTTLLTPTTPAPFISTNTRNYERKYTGTSTETPDATQENNPLIEDLNIEALNARNKKIFDINSKKHTTIKPKVQLPFGTYAPPTVDESQHTKQNIETENDETYQPGDGLNYATTTSTPIQTPVSNLNSDDDLFNNELSSQGTTTQPPSTTLLHIFTLNEDGEATTTLPQPPPTPMPMAKFIGRLVADKVRPKHKQRSPTGNLSSTSSSRRPIVNARRRLYSSPAVFTTSVTQSNDIDLTTTSDSPAYTTSKYNRLRSRPATTIPTTLSFSSPSSLLLSSQFESPNDTESDFQSQSSSVGNTKKQNALLKIKLDVGRDNVAATSSSVAATLSNDVTPARLSQKYPSPVLRRKYQSRRLTTPSPTYAGDENGTEPPRTQNPLFKRRFSLTSTTLPPFTSTKLVNDVQTTTYISEILENEDASDQIAKSSIHSSHFNQLLDRHDEDFAGLLTTTKPTQATTAPNYITNPTERAPEEIITRRMDSIINQQVTRKPSVIRRRPLTTTPTSTEKYFASPSREGSFANQRRPHKFNEPFDRLNSNQARPKQTSKTTISKSNARTSTPSYTNYKTNLDYDYYDDGDLPVVGNRKGQQLKVILHGRGIIECLDQGNFPHPLSCRKFISCAKFETGGVVGWEYTCPKGLSYDPVGGMCNWAAGLGCKD